MFVLALSLYNTWNRGVFLLCKITNLLIYSYQNKLLNRTAQRISLIGLLGIIGRIAKDCAEREDETGKKVVKFLFVLILVSQILLGIDAISDVIERRK